MKVWIPILFIFMLSGSLLGQTSHKLLRSADEQYSKQDFQSAEETYRKANEKKPTFNGEYNLGNSIFEQSRFEEALNHYEQAATLSADPNVKSDAYYNLGNTYMNMENYEKGVEAYKNALRNNPNDEDIEEDEKRTQQKLRKTDTKNAKPKKDW